MQESISNKPLQNDCRKKSEASHFRKVSEHPCYDKKARHRFGRMHLAVAKKCNIHCNFCDRKFDCVNESRPGVTSRLLTPDEALEKTREVLQNSPNIKVVGISGPGDPLANDETFITMERIKRSFPHLTLCMSTNGLLLPDKMPELVDLGIGTLTVTINAIQPEIQVKICDGILYQGKVYKGLEGAEILVKQQLEGIRQATANGMFVKVNTVYIPGINEHHIIDIAKKVKEMNGYVMNIMPLINQAKFAHITPPTRKECQEMQDNCKVYVEQMRHCRQCRADEIGLLKRRTIPAL